MIVQGCPPEYGRAAVLDQSSRDSPLTDKPNKRIHRPKLPRSAILTACFRRMEEFICEQPIDC